MKGCGKDVSPFLPRATKQGTFQGPPSLEPSIGHQVEVFPRLLPSPFL